MSLPPEPHYGARWRADLRLLSLSAFGPTLSMVALSVLYALSDRACERIAPLLWALWGAATALTALSGLALWRWHPAARADAATPTQEGRLRFVMHTGLALNLISLLLLLGFASPLMLLRPCQ